MRLICDEMLRGLAKYLRAAGHDTAVPEAGLDDDAVLGRARAEGRVLITRDRDLWERTAEAEAVWLSGQSLEDWVRELDDALGIDWLRAPFSRCLLCNRPLQRDGENDEGRTQLRCDGCRKRYWEGSHTRRMRQQLRRFQNMGGWQG